jgi:hypothetical protein
MQLAAVLQYQPLLLLAAVLQYQPLLLLVSRTA